MEKPDPALDLVTFVASELQAMADPARAAGAAAYMKTEMPFYGVSAPQRKTLMRRVKRLFPPDDEQSYRANVVALWEQPHREEKYMAISYARAFEDFVTLDQIDLYRRMIVEGAWWDLVDEIAAHLVGRVVLAHREEMRPILDDWVAGEDMWLQRTAIICQLRHRDVTDEAMLFDYCRRSARHKDFFIRKAIGWALRSYARVDPHAVRGFLAEMGDELSGLSRREAAKHL